MPTVDELLNASNEVTTCTIDPDTREIIVPEKYKILGVFSDEKVTKIPFTCPKVVGNNVDLTEYNLYINYQNASGGRNAYLVDDVTVSGDNITFSWLLSRYVTLSPGVVTYSLCAKKLDGETTVTEWNTTIAKGTVIPGLETIQEIIEENPDIIETILSKMHTHDNKAVLDKFAETDGKPTYDGEAIGGGASTAENISYTISEDIQNEFPELAELESDTVKSGLDLAMYYAFAGLLAKNIECDVPTLTGTIKVDLQSVMDGWRPALEKAHEHVNKSVLDLISATDGKLQYNGSDVGLKGADGTDGKDGITPTIGTNGNWYLGTTDTGKPSRGEKGDTGAAGADGKTPVKGTDYWTAEDKAEIVADTLAALPTWTGGSY